MTSKTWLKNAANSWKNGPGEAQNGSKMNPKSRKRRSPHQNGTRWRPRVVRVNDETALGHIFGSSLGAEKSRKNRFFSPKSRPKERFFIDFWCERRFPRFFDWFLVDFGWKIDGKKLVFFKSPSHFFQHGNPHETLYFIIRKLLFHFLSFWFFFKKMMKKNGWKIHLPKKSKNDPRGIPK